MSHGRHAPKPDRTCRAWHWLMPLAVTVANSQTSLVCFRASAHCDAATRQTSQHLWCQRPPIATISSDHSTAKATFALSHYRSLQLGVDLLLSVWLSLNISKKSRNIQDHVHCCFQLGLHAILSPVLKTRATAWENLRGLEIKQMEAVSNARQRTAGHMFFERLTIIWGVRSSFADNCAGDVHACSCNLSSGFCFITEASLPSYCGLRAFWKLCATLSVAYCSLTPSKRVHQNHDNFH
jgi:hypothetical protein